jgi:hypothetical protein
MKMSILADKRLPGEAEEVLGECREQLPGRAEMGLQGISLTARQVYQNGQTHHKKTKNSPHRFWFIHHTESL